MSPVKRLALEHNLDVLQPERLRTPEAVAALARLAPDIIVVVAFGQILRQNILDLPRFGCLNVHASLLPRHRGASPIAYAILEGDTETGITIIRMDAGMDTGDIVAQAREPIRPDDTAGSLGRRLADLGAQVLLDTLPRWLRGEIVPQPQDHAAATVTRLIKKEDGQIDWTQPATRLERAVRAYTPWPGAYTFWQGRLLKILRAAVIPSPMAAAPGTVLATRDGPAVATGEGALLLKEVQLEGRRAITGREFAMGQRGFIGAQVGA